MITGFWMSQIARSAASFSLARRLAEGGKSSPVLAQEIGLDPSATFRFLRACASLGLVDYRDGEFYATSLLTLLDPDVPGSLWGLAMALNMPGHWLSWGRLPEAICHGKSQAEAALGADIWSYYKQNPQESTAFIHAFTNFNANIGQQIRPLLDIGKASLAVDVGGSGGAVVAGLLRAHPSLSGIVFDLPDVVKEAAPRWPEDLVGRCSFVGGDFFKEVPSADLYLLRLILHDWSDEECLTILRNCRRAIKPDGRLFIIEHVLDEIGTPDLTVFMDMNMLAVASGQERSRAEYRRLLEATGFGLEKVWPTDSPLSILEVRAS
jgi:hypothetical protein